MKTANCIISVTIAKRTEKTVTATVRGEQDRQVGADRVLPYIELRSGTSMEDKTLCPLCGEGYVTPRTESMQTEYRGKQGTVMLRYAECDACGSEITGDADGRANKRAVLAFRKSVDGLLTPAEAAEWQRRGRTGWLRAELRGSKLWADKQLPSGVKRQDVCVWMQDSDGTWCTSCGVTWEFIDGMPADNKAHFCHHCGGVLLGDGFEEVSASGPKES